jgi:2-polyprenyl-6-methoxyphenol hydroxylase-like FAD-dependent oxidoreductase
MMKSTEVFICGAGPTGLVLALWLTKMGVKVRIIDKSDQPGTTSRAIVLQARNLEFYHQIGIDGLAIENGKVFQAANLWVKGRKVAHVRFGDPDNGISPYPYGLFFPQDLHEEMLVEELLKAGIAVERNTELISFEQSPDGVVVHLKKYPDTMESYQARYLAGCDGAHSAVRRLIDAEFPGGTYEDIFYVADLEAAGAVINGQLNIALDEADFLAIFPMKGAGRIRLVGAVRRDAKNRDQFTWDDISQSIIERLKMNVNKVRWFSTYKVHHRVASFFKKENAFLLGDAGHLHSPVGGQGMNTGIGDAVNLAWKLAAVLNQQTPALILDSYEPERIKFARRLVSTTDKAFEFINKRSSLATLVRTRIVPPILSFLFHLRFVRRFMFLMLSQTKINYRKSILSEGLPGKLQSGDRLPWIKFKNEAGLDSDNFESLKTMKWQLHCYGKLPGDLQQFLDKGKLEYYIFPWNNTMLSKGIKKEVIYIVRPDGYIGLIAFQNDLSVINNYLDKWNIRGHSI